MPSQITHLAIAKRFLQKHAHLIKNVQRFLDGNVVPDLAANKAESHCGVRTEMHDIVKRNIEKVNPMKFAITHDMSDDFNKGQYLHLYVDDQFYNVFLLGYFKQYLASEQITTDMYETTRRDDVYLGRKYGVAYGDTSLECELQKINDIWDAENVEKRRQPDYKFTFPYDFTALDEFIEKMSDAIIPE